MIQFKEKMNILVCFNKKINVRDKMRVDELGIEFGEIEIHWGSDLGEKFS